MRRIMLTVTGILIAAFLITGCSEAKNVQWMSLPLTSCPGKMWNEIKDDKKRQKENGALECGIRSKSYGGEWRCKDGGIQVKCE